MAAECNRTKTENNWRLADFLSAVFHGELVKTINTTTIVE